MKKILFLCVANSARSQMAEALARQILGDAVEVQSAGSEPSGVVHRQALAVLEEKGIDTLPLHSKGIDALDAEFMDGLDRVVTLCAEEVCPVLHSKAKRLHWPHADPAAVQGNEEEEREAFRAVRDSIERHIRALALDGLP